MCGRFTLSRDAAGLKEAFPLLPVLQRLQARYNVAPSQPVPAWLMDPTPRMELFSWGLVPHWAKSPDIGNRLINARAETLLEKPSFRGSFRRKRCAVPADGWYEWQSRPGKAKQPMWFHRRDRGPFAFAGLWDEWHDKEGGMILSCVIITTRPNELARRIHPRMPAVLREDDVMAWLDPNTQDTGELLRMLEPVASDEFAVHPVSSAVNRAGVEGADLIGKVEPRPDPPAQPDLF